MRIGERVVFVLLLLAEQPRSGDRNDRDRNDQRKCDRRTNRQRDIGEQLTRFFLQKDDRQRMPASVGGSIISRLASSVCVISRSWTSQPKT
ncbi:hypothetical protein [Blastopirellula retiformator]|uniref:hypothetical protein n=1 Tax=Blastopirellula retiformator TaxID=2527970 RepID=UPI001FEAAB8E|nr:hypothetical protein [Blastopirellula retiformator]